MQEEFELTQEELDSLRKVLDDETLWSQVKVEADFNSTLSIPLSQNGIQMFDQVIKASIKLFEIDVPVVPVVPVVATAKAKRGRKPKN